MPQPHNFHDGVLLMELVADAQGDAAPRLNDVEFGPAHARAHHATLIRDVGNLRDFFGRAAPELRASRYGEEIWDLYQRGMLQPETALSGRFERAAQPVDLSGVLREIDDARADETARRLRMQSVP